MIYPAGVAVATSEDDNRRRNTCDKSDNSDLEGRIKLPITQNNSGNYSFSKEVNYLFVTVSSGDINVKNVLKSVVDEISRKNYNCTTIFLN